MKLTQSGGKAVILHENKVKRVDYEKDSYGDINFIPVDSHDIETRDYDELFDCYIQEDNDSGGFHTVVHVLAAGQGDGDVDWNNDGFRMPDPVETVNLAVENLAPAVRQLINGNMYCSDFGSAAGVISSPILLYTHWIKADGDISVAQKTILKNKYGVPA